MEASDKRRTEDGRPANRANGTPPTVTSEAVAAADRASLAASPSEEIGGPATGYDDATLLRDIARGLYGGGWYRAGVQVDKLRERIQCLADRVAPTLAGRSLDEIRERLARGVYPTHAESEAMAEQLARSSEGAREAERLRAAADGFAADLIDGYDHEEDAHRHRNGACRVCKAEAFRASLRATPPETETEP